jgi:hypothetical protein
MALTLAGAGFYFGTCPLNYHGIGLCFSQLGGKAPSVAGLPFFGRFHIPRMAGWTGERMDRPDNTP